MSTEAMKLALEALESCDTGHITDGSRQWYDERLVDKAITALDEALVQPQQEQEQEPVAGCVCRWNSEGDRVVTCERHQGWLEVIAEWADRAREAEKKLKVLNTSPPPQRKPLTDEEVETVWRSVQANDFHDCVKPFARAIEAAHNIKGDA